METNNIIEKLNQVVSKEPSKWNEEAEFRYENKKWLKRSQTLALKILRTIREQGITQKELAERIGVSAQQVNKWVKGTENFTLETISKLEEALKIELINVSGFATNYNYVIQKTINLKIDTIKLLPQSNDTIIEYNTNPLTVSYNKYNVDAA